MSERQSPRHRRLHSDFESVEKLHQESSIFSFKSAGNPPRRYRMRFRGAGVCRDPQGEIKIREQHEVLVDLGAAYPRMIPSLAWQTPIFHPNISNNGVVCLGGYGTHWVPSLTLDELCTMLWDMIRYKNFDAESPYNREAALWARHQTEFQFPIDKRSIRDRISSQKNRSDQNSSLSRAEKAQPNPSSRDEEVVDAVLVRESPRSTTTRPSRDSPEIEIIESGIEIIDSNVRSTEYEGILFLD